MPALAKLLGRVVAGLVRSREENTLETALGGTAGLEPVRKARADDLRLVRHKRSAIDEGTMVLLTDVDDVVSAPPPRTDPHAVAFS